MPTRCQLVRSTGPYKYLSLEFSPGSVSSPCGPSWIAEELGRQYSLGYYPNTPGKEGERRQIKVKVTEADMVVKARDSYIYSEKAKKFAQVTQLTQ